MSNQRRSPSGAHATVQVANTLHVAQGVVQAAQMHFGMEFVNDPAAAPTGVDFAAKCGVSAIHGASLGAGAARAAVRMLDLPKEVILVAALVGAAVGGYVGYVAVQRGARVQFAGKVLTGNAAVPAAA